MPRSDKEVEDQLAAVQAQRDQLAAAELERARVAKDRDNDQTFLQLKQEELRIAQQVAAAKNVAKLEAEAAEADNKALQEQIEATQAALDGVTPELPEDPNASTEGAAAVPTTGQADTPASEVVQGDETNESTGGVN